MTAALRRRAVALHAEGGGGADSPALGEPPDETPGDRRCQQRAAVCHRADGAGELVGG